MNSSPNQPIRYIYNPDVVLREEDPDGGLLFNPDTNQVKILNHTGLFIWKMCDGKHEFPAIITSLQQSYDGVPEDMVSDQVKTYIDELVDSGFIGVIEN